MARRLAPLARADCARRARRADVAGELGVGARLAVGDAPQGVPDAALEGAPRVLQRQVEGAPAAGEVLVQLRAQRREERALAGGERAAEPPAQRLQLRLHHAPVGVLEQTQRVVGRAGDERADRRLEPGEADERAVGRRRRFAGRRPRQLAERACGSRSATPSRARRPPRRCASPERRATKASPSRRARQYAWKVMPCVFWNQRRTAAGSRPSARRSASVMRADGSASTRAMSRAAHSGAPASGSSGRQRLHGPEAGHERLARGGVELHVLRLRVAGRARRAAEHAGGRHRGVEQPVVAAVALAQRGEHLLAREQAARSGRGAAGPL